MADGLQRADDGSQPELHPSAVCPLSAGLLRRAFRPPPPSGGPEPATLFLGLNLVLLAFFALLVAVSHPEEDRTRLVLASLHSAFAAHIAASLGLPRDDGPDATAGGRPLERIERLLRPSLPITADAAFAGGRLELGLDPAAVFEEGDAALRSEIGVLLRRLAFVLGGPPGRDGVRATVELVGPRVLDGGGALARARLDALARRLAEDGADGARLHVGLAEGARRLRVVLEPASGDDG
jgi:hypothetical protein